MTKVSSERRAPDVRSSHARHRTALPDRGRRHLDYRLCDPPVLRAPGPHRAACQCAPLQARERILYWMVFTAFVLAPVYAFSPFLDAAQVRLPAAVRWLGTAFRSARRRSAARDTSRARPQLVRQAGDRGQPPADRGGSVSSRATPDVHRAVLHSVRLQSAVGHWIVASANILAVTLMYLARVRDEEQMLIDQFGDEYRAYMKRTGRLVPRMCRAEG